MPGKFHGQRSLADYRGHEEPDTTEHTAYMHADNYTLEQMNQEKEERCNNLRLKGW